MVALGIAGWKRTFAVGAEGSAPETEDVDYYRARALEERELAQAAGRENVREIHEELARQYEALVERAEIRPGRPTLSIRAA